MANEPTPNPNMKKPLSLGVASVLLATATLWGSTVSGIQDRDESAGIPDQFIGAWRLVALEVVDADGKVHRGDSTGMFVFTREGRLAVQVMDRTPQSAPHPGPEQYAKGGYEATFGRFEVDERTHTFTYSRRGQPGPRPGRQGFGARLPVQGQPAHREVHQPRGALARRVGALLT